MSCTALFLTLPVEALYIGEDTFPVRFSELHHVLHLQQGVDVGQGPGDGGDGGGGGGGGGDCVAVWWWCCW